tara:strand:+ start:3193 stop:3315 length:123 start_codon:yes stop_codon:yes gene_type:complete
MVTKRNAKTIKKVVRKLKKASKAHAGQAKALSKIVRKKQR